ACCLLVFFASRRRHTRLVSDWSSDVCSSDLFSAGLTQAMWQELSTDPRNPLSDKVIGGLYPPGSTFKPVVALAALEAGVISPDKIGRASGRGREEDAVGAGTVEEKSNGTCER